MDAKACLRAGQLEAARAALLAELRQHPEISENRVLLFALDCVLGRWEKALAHLDTLAALTDDWRLAAEVNRRLIAGESVRREVFSGRQPPLILGEPPAWVAYYVEALRLEAGGAGEAAGNLRARAWDESPAFPVVVNDCACEWLSDSDARLGPILEVFMEGQYYWVPFGQIRGWKCGVPAVLLEVVWLPGHLELITGAELPVYLPVRYPGTEISPNDALRLAQRTEWVNSPGGRTGLGQKDFESDRGDFGLLECRTVRFGTGESGKGGA